MLTQYLLFFTYKDWDPSAGSDWSVVVAKTHYSLRVINMFNWYAYSKDLVRSIVLNPRIIMVDYLAAHIHPKYL